MESKVEQARAEAKQAIHECLQYGAGACRNEDYIEQLRTSLAEWAAEARQMKLERDAAAAQSHALVSDAEAEQAWQAYPPVVSGWYWTRNNDDDPTPAVCYWKESGGLLYIPGRQRPMLPYPKLEFWPVAVTFPPASAQSHARVTRAVTATIEAAANTCEVDLPDANDFTGCESEIRNACLGCAESIRAIDPAAFAALAATQGDAGKEG